jgi:hypothetical protein
MSRVLLSRKAVLFRGPSDRTVLIKGLPIRLGVLAAEFVFNPVQTVERLPDQLREGCSDTADFDWFARNVGCPNFVQAIA